ncbi:MAG: MerR family DNA-binding transcriptional regulator, partial [Solirubrobacteraceae bacterium]
MSPDQLGDQAHELSIGEAARVLGVSVRTVRRWHADGVLAVERTAGGHRRFRLEEMLELRVKRDRGAATPRAELRRPSLPIGPAPELAAILSEDARRELLRRTVTHLYPEDQRGWFASIPAIQASNAFLGALRRAASTGDWTESVSAATELQVKAGSAGDDVTYQEYFRFMRTLRAVLVGAMGERASLAAKTLGRLFERLEYDAAGKAAEFAASPARRIGADLVGEPQPRVHEEFDPGDVDAVSRSCDRLGRASWVLAVMLLAGDANAAELDVIATTAGARSGEPLVLVDDELAAAIERG